MGKDKNKAVTTTKLEHVKNDSSSPVTSIPPVQAAVRRLERLLGGGYAPIITNNNGNNASESHYTCSDPGTSSPASLSSSVKKNHVNMHGPNPSRIVRRWLGTSSGASSAATLGDLADAAKTFLDPEGPCVTGCELLLNLEQSFGADKIEKMDESSDVGSKVGTTSAITVDSDVTMEDTPELPSKENLNTGSEQSTSYLLRSQREVECWLLSVATKILYKQGLVAEASDLAGKGVRIAETHIEEAISLSGTSTSSNHMAGGTISASTSGMYPLLSRMFRLACLYSEKCNGDARKESAITSRDAVVHSYRIACLRRDVDTQATLLNIILRNLLMSDQVEQAQKLLSNSTFPESASNNQLCRFLYYSGRIQALRLKYTSSFSNLSQCLRKTPTNTGLGFRIAVQRLLVVVQLLMGEIPDRSVFFTKGMIWELAPYLKLTQAVRRGDLSIFHSTVNQFALRFREDCTHTLISRLAHSVVKAGLRRLNTSYSRISLVDIASLLGLANATSAEFVVAKAVRDNVIDATIHSMPNGGGYVQSHDLVDVYATTEPSEAFHRRIAYCLTTHNDAVRGMRYPPDAYKKQLEASRGLRGKKDDEKTDEEKAQELEDELDEDY
mmetsp:Transcript_18712/g.26363  ORF Transcript_18712/g.26363 Transcript_18712/m.26363 type:complete len:612 (+) Transcript_18712:169-2004(+)|eukprot:CAMPEP_0184866552 /NCGR_PEP_ID=MMETSP0580-20130426/22787_1 /TAXON_ID=1118495 /ORGANISM="Dactyliosolen fragilissimus" /LENGTH=611 /DNA_ID=CAMNT_0027366291 /DNA_START=150 /DNA_END=1985 /DNA_ORIENTATION=-